MPSPAVMCPLHPSLRALATGWLLAAAGVAFAAGDADDPVAQLQSAYSRAVVPGEEADLHRELAATVLQRIKRSHATDVDLASFVAAAVKVLDARAPQSGEPAEAFKAAINAALRTIDGESRYMDARSYAEERADASGSFVGVGIQVEPLPSAVRVVGVLPDSPAARGGLAVGDLILRVDGAPLEGVPLADAISRLRGPAGTPVSLTLQRSSGDVTVSLTRDTIRQQLVRWSMEGDALVLRISSFSGPVSALLAHAIAEASARHFL